MLKLMMSTVIMTTMMMMSGLALAQQQKCYFDISTERSTVDCRSRSLPTVPKFQPSNVTYDTLLLSNNRIQYIGASAFNGIRFRKLEIKDNPLCSIHHVAFTGLESTLTEVVLDLDEKWGEFPDSALRSLLNLTVLKVARYANSSLPPGALRGLSTLRELSLTPGNLESLMVDDLADQRSSLEILDIGNNKLREFPTYAIQTLTALKALNVRANQIVHLGGSSIASSSLEDLDISHHALNRAGINSSAFAGVASTLRRLRIAHCHLDDRYTPAITRAAAVNELIISFNQLTSTSVRTFLADMPNLERLDAQNNSVDELTTQTLPSTRRLRALNLAYNPLRRIQPDAFVELRSLEDLKLDSASVAMGLDGDSFAAQRSTLRNLSLRGVSLQWSVVSGLERLERVSLRGCRLSNIPPFTFRASGGRLHDLELANNQIDELNQRAFVGLEASLVRLDLSSNSLTTIGRCTFHGFTKLDPKLLTLRNNSLVCDCRLRWLYNWTLDYRTFNPWRCADGRWFWQLTDSDFQRCNASVDDRQPCEDFTLTTPSTPVRQLISLLVVNVTSTSLAVRWTADLSALPVAASGFRVNCSCADSSRSVNMTVRELRFDGLSGGVRYRICVVLEHLDGNWTGEVASCTYVSTTTWLRDPLVLFAVIVSAVLLLVALPLTVAVCLYVRRWRRRRRMRLAELAQPKIAAGKTKRFMRQQRTPSLDALTDDRVEARRFQSRSVETNLDTLQEDEDRYRTLLALRLLQSRNARSLDNLVDGVNATPSYFMNQLYEYGSRDNLEQEVYDEINDTEVDGCKSPLSTEDTVL